MNTENTVDFDEMLGEELDFYGTDGPCFKLDDTVYEVVERDDQPAEIRECHFIGHCFHATPIARVVVENGAFSDEVYALVDLHDGHCWLEFGTECEDIECRDTQFLFDYTPKAPISND